MIGKLIILIIFFFTPAKVTSNNLLPVELIFFFCEAGGNTVALYWGTATEVNNYGYYVERSGDQFNWSDIGFIPGHGNSSSPKEYSFMDSTILESGVYFYRLKQYDTDGRFEYSDVLSISIKIVSSQRYSSAMKPEKFQLYQNYPNPFNSSTKIIYALNEPAFVSLKIFSIDGSIIATIIDEWQNTGLHSIDFTGKKLSSGIFICKLQAGNKSVSRKIILIK